MCVPLVDIYLGPPHTDSRGFPPCVLKKAFRIPKQWGAPQIFSHNFGPGMDWKIPQMFLPKVVYHPDPRFQKLHPSY